MTSHHQEPRELLAAKINSETARLSWSELAPLFAQGMLLRVTPGVDLITLALAIASDEVATVQGYQQRGQLAPVSDDEALSWHQTQTELWTVVVKPFVLVQPVVSCHAPLQ